MVCTSAFLPFLIGAVSAGPVGRVCVTESSLLLSIASAFLAVCLWGIAAQWGQQASTKVQILTLL